MMKLYQEHKVNPMASCLPLVAQMPVFIIMFRILHGMTYEPVGGDALVAQSVLDAGGDTRPIGFVPALPVDRIRALPVARAQRDDDLVRARPVEVGQARCSASTSPRA